MNNYISCYILQSASDNPCYSLTCSGGIRDHSFPVVRDLEWILRATSNSPESPYQPRHPFRWHFIGIYNIIIRYERLLPLDIARWMPLCGCRSRLPMHPLLRTPALQRCCRAPHIAPRSLAGGRQRCAVTMTATGPLPCCVYPAERRGQVRPWGPAWHGKRRTDGLS